MRADSIGDRMYKQAQEQQKRREEMMKRQYEQVEQGGLYSPRINTMKTRPGKQVNQTGGARVVKPPARVPPNRSVNESAPLAHGSSLNQPSRRPEPSKQAPPN